MLHNINIMKCRNSQMLKKLKYAAVLAQPAVPADRLAAPSGRQGGGRTQALGTAEMSRDQLAIVVIWSVVLGLVGEPLLNSPVEETRLCMSIGPWWVLAFPIPVAAAVAALSRSSPFYVPFIATWVNSRFGPETYERFTVRLRPMLLFSAGSFVTAAGIYFTCRNAGGSGPAAFFVFGGLAFALAHAIQRYRKIPGV
jgi:hypothetical protein